MYVRSMSVVAGGALLLFLSTGPVQAKATKSAQVGGGPSPNMFCEDGCYLRDAAVAGFAAAGALAGAAGSPVGEVLGAAAGGAFGGFFYDASTGAGDGWAVAEAYQAAADVVSPTQSVRDPRALN